MPPPMIATLRDWAEVVVDDMLFVKMRPIEGSRKE